MGPTSEGGGVVKQDCSVPIWSIPNVQPRALHSPSATVDDPTVVK